MNSIGKIKIITTEKNVAISGKKNMKWVRRSLSFIEHHTTLYTTYGQKQMGKVHMQLYELQIAMDECEMFGNCVEP